MKPTELMGKIVTVHTVLHRERYGRGKDKEDGFKWVETYQCKEWAGWIVGIRRKQEGYWNWISGGGYGCPEYDERYFDVTKTIPLLMVVPWVTMNHKWVPLDGYTLGGTPAPPGYKWTDKDRAKEKEWFAKFPSPRDKRGRFIK